jgi:hypothetical protein
MGYRGKLAVLALTWGLGLVFTPLGCGSSRMGTIARASSGGPTAPESTVSRLTDCANEGVLA